MTEWLNRCHFGDCLETMRRMPDGIAQTCVTSPPYFGLRDYGHAGQIGLEPTPAEFVAKLVDVFREVRRVLRDDGTLWLNLGDSYAGGGGGNFSKSAKQTSHGEHITNVRNRESWLNDVGLKAKDLIGIPWRVAFALQQPYYSGRIRDLMDRIWLAAMIDAEGCFFIHKRKAGSASGAKFTRADGSEVAYDRVNDTFSPGIEVCNTHPAIVQRCMEIAGVGSMSVQQDGRKQTLYRWTARGEEARMLAREVYPHLVGKMQQARIVAGCPTSGDKASAGHEALKGLHHGTATDVDFAKPASPFEPGWYLRQDVIWAKPNPMPESVTDRCTKSHEYIFLLSKAPSYYCDMGAVKEPVTASSIARLSQDVDAQHGSDRVPGKTNGAMKAVGGARSKRDSFKREESKRAEAIPGQAVGTHRDDRKDGDWPLDTRNKRSVWTVATTPYAGAHFATFPSALIEPCILAGAPAGGVVLDPFFGSGTTGQVAQDLGRHFIGCELNPDYQPLQAERLRQMGLILEAA